MGVRAILALAGCVTAAAFGVCRAAPPAATTKAFCAANPNDDNPARASATEVPPEVKQAGGNVWRCMDGRVLICNIGADGYPCQKMDPSLKPAKPVRDFCAAHPGSDFVPMYVLGASASTWRCDGATPRPLKTQLLDERDFVKGAWQALPR